MTMALPCRASSVRVGLLWGLAAACGLVLFQDWRTAAVLGAAALVALFFRFPFFGLLCVVTTVFVGTPTLKIPYLPGVATQFFPAMLLLPPTLLGFLAAGARPRVRFAAVRRENLTPLAPFVAAVLTLHLLAIAWAPHVEFALGQAATLVFDVLLFFTLVIAVDSPRRLRTACWTMVASAVLVCATMVLGALYAWAGSIPLGTGAQLNFELFSEERWGRIGGLCSANQAGGFLVFTTFLTLGLSRLYRRLARVALCLLALTFLSFVVVSGSRGAILGFLGASGLFMLCHAPTRRRLLSRSTLLAVALLVAILAGKPSFIDRMLVGFGYSGPLLFSEKKTSDSSSNVSGSGARFRMWKQALGVMADEPGLMVLGLGPGGFIWHTGEPEVHSLWLAFFFDLGLAGGLVGLLGLTVLGTSVGAALRRAPPGTPRTLFVAVVVASLAEIGIHSLIDHDLTSPVSRFTWLYVALLAAALQVVRHCPPRPGPTAAPLPAPGGALAASAAPGR